MSKRLMISEEEKKHIMRLYEQSKETYSTLIGYLINLSKSGTGKQGINDMGAIKEYRVYLENLRDGKPVTPLSRPAEIVKNYVSNEIKNLSGEELVSLSNLGANIHTKN